MIIQKNSRQIPSKKEICSSKEYYDILYAYLQQESLSDCKYDEDGKVEKVVRRYIPKKDIKFTKLAEILHLSRQTVSTKFKNLEKLKLIEYNEKEMIYEIIPLPQKEACLIPYGTLRLLCNTLNEYSISTYVYLLNRYFANGCKSYQFTLDNIKSFIGISTTTRSNNDIITDILLVLQKLEFIKYKVFLEGKDNGVKTIYQIDYVTNKLNDELEQEKMLKKCTGSKEKC